VTTNLREWRHILRLREDKAAHPQMRELMALVRPILEGVAPNVFGKEVEQ
jgi:thymidylate synthase (FAD)